MYSTRALQTVTDKQTDRRTNGKVILIAARLLRTTQRSLKIEKMLSGFSLAVSATVRVRDDQ